jgi:hypothetical protein
MNARMAALRAQVCESFPLALPAAAVIRLGARQA